MKEFQTVPLATLVEHPLNPRRTFDASQFDELKRSIAEVGVLTPLLVRPLHNGRAGKLEIIAGARRYRAASAIGVTAVPVRVHELDDTQALEVLTIENLQRADVHPLEEAEGYRALMAQANYDVAKVAERIGKSESYVYQRLKLCELTEPVKDAFLEGRLTAGHAILLARLQPKDQEEALQTCVTRFYDDRTRKPIEEAAGVRALDAWIKTHIHLDLHRAPWRKDDATLLPAAGACSVCVKRVGNAPALFPDVAKKDTCTDRTCYHAKLAAHVERKQQELTAANAGKPVPLVSTAYYWAGDGQEVPEGTLKPGDFETVGKARCRSATTALVVNGDGVGKAIEICVDPSCRKHRGRYNSGARGDESYREQQRLAAKKDKAAKQARAATISAALEATKWPLSSEDLRDVALVMFKSLGAYFAAPVLKRHEWGSNYYEADKQVRKYLADIDNTELARFLVELTLVGEIPDTAGRSPIMRGLLERHDVRPVKPGQGDAEAPSAAAGPKATLRKKRPRAKAREAA